MGSMPKNTDAYQQAKLLVTAIEERANWTPNNTYMRYPGPDWETKGYDTISWKQYASAIDKAAYWLDHKLGEAVSNDTIAYYGPNDPRYGILVPATMKTGRNILVPDGRVSAGGLEDLLKSTNCKAWITAEDDTREPLIGETEALRTLALPSLEWLLESVEQERYPYDKTFEQVAHEAVIVIHTSGTTGKPKPIYQTNGYWSAIGTGTLLSQRHWPRGLAHESWIGRTVLNCCAPQWMAGLHALITAPAFYESPCVMLPPDATSPSPELFKKVLAMNRIDGLMCPPHTVVTLYEDLETQAMLKSLKFVLFLGAALDRSVGDDLCEHIRVTPLIGATETGDQMSIRPADRKLWYTHDFVPENGSTMVPIEDDESDLHELVLERPKDGSVNIFQAAFWNSAFDGFDRIETKDLYAPIIDSDGRTRWIFSARKDDLTKLNWLAKFHAHDIEARILKHSAIKSVCVGGEGRPTPYVIVEAKEGVLDRTSPDQLLEDLYATVIAKTNAKDIDEIRIPKETVLLARAEKLFKRNLKQVVMRKEVEKDYQDEIEEAYAQLEKVRASAAAAT
ncbi:acetyl-CoA synthetase-like protein [Setomelanomma holmii]|uniref:Acetyl-CoA synthetase-like protein n=1 Tax=Setomelanomma holmii TaxID=210430 RepID=A0A9P4H7E9_9PLEO|nr:acetyl-CoA synthetase-like protein [Setomelanomma holmii]